MFRQKLKKTTQNHKIKKQKKNNKITQINTGHPAHHSAANKYLSGSGWMSCIVVLLCLFSKFCFCCVCCYMYFVDCKCKSSNRLRENRKTTGYHPAHHSAANKYLSGSGWMSCIVVLLFCSRSCVVVILCLLELFRLYMQKLKQTRQQLQQTKEQQTKNTKTFENNKQQRKYNTSSPPLGRE